MKNNNLTLLLIILLLGGIIGYFVSRSFHPTENTVTIDTVKYVDTLYLQKTETITKWKAKLDTVKVTVNDTVFQKIEVASADTLLEKDSNKVSVKYYFPPLNYFDVKFDINEKIVKETKEILKTVTLDEPLLHESSFIIAVVSVLTNIFLLSLILG